MFQPSSSLGQHLGSAALRYRQPASWTDRRAAGGMLGLIALPKLQEANQEAVGKSHRETAAKVEAVLFLAREPLGSRKMAELAGLADGTKARTLVRLLNRRYDAEGSAFRVEEVAGGFQLLTRPKFAPWLRRLYATPVEVRLSAPALETLAVVAYRQPVLRAEIEAIRGVQCGEILRQLIERELVRIAGRSEELGRPLLYGTTRRFLQVFGLRHLEDLPRAEFMPITNPVAPDSGEASATSQTEHSRQTTHFPQAEEENSMKTLATMIDVPDELRTRSLASAVLPGRAPAMPVGRAADEDDDDFDDDDEEDDDLEEEEDDLEEDEWEEVDDEDEEDLDDEDEDDEDWDDEDEWDDEDDDWEDEDDWDEDEDEKEEDDDEE